MIIPNRQKVVYKNQPYTFFLSLNPYLTFVFFKLPQLLKKCRSFRRVNKILSFNKVLFMQNSQIIGFHFFTDYLVK